MPSFDIVSELDLQEVDNAVNQAKKEIVTRYDFKGSKSSISFEKPGPIVVLADDKMKLQAINEILSQKLAKRGVSIKSLDRKETEKASGDMLRQEVALKQGISQDDAKKLIKTIKDMGVKKAQAQIQGEQVRVTAPKRDDLQLIIQNLKSASLDIDLQFNNFRD
ncbi:MAG TPA: YajQ family cyclic di-GMP-binding protein [Oligoflexia bacterium]|nr:YajQ family cyclic di-GMP-binding protein [Oligoflexia bacterium]HMP47230.1 YajQ family cyclic di-GMP-binding protein [Oligoflexia bacterium]